jgi:hypothetical protein
MAEGGDGGGGMAEGGDVDAGENIESAMSETSPEASGAINAYTNVGTPGSKQITDTAGYGTQTQGSSFQDQAAWFEAQKKENDALVASNWGRPKGNQSATESQKQSSQPEAPKPPEQKKEESKSSGGMSAPVKSAGPAMNPFPSNVIYSKQMPQITMPVPGSGVKKAFFDAQADTLKAMLPYWKG